MFDRILGTQETNQTDFKLEERKHQVCLQNCLVPKVHEDILKKVEDLVELGVIK